MKCSRGTSPISKVIWCARKDKRTYPYSLVKTCLALYWQTCLDNRWCEFDCSLFQIPNLNQSHSSISRSISSITSSTYPFSSPGRWWPTTNSRTMWQPHLHIAKMNNWSLRSLLTSSSTSKKRISSCSPNSSLICWECFSGSSSQKSSFIGCIWESCSSRFVFSGRTSGIIRGTC